MASKDKYIKELETENTKLKEDLKAETEQAQKWYQIETDKHFLALKYLNILEKIKEIAERLLEKGLEPQSVEHQLRLRGKEELAQVILQLINESEVLNE